MSSQKTIPERRRTRRLPVSIGAVIYYNSLMLPECQLTELSSEGAFIVTHGHFLPDHALLDLAISVDSATGAAPRVTAQVMRCTEDGVGVRLQLADSPSLCRLVESLYSA